MTLFQACTRRCALRHQLCLVLCAASIALSASVAAQTQAQTVAEVDATLDALFGTHAPYKSFLEALQNAVAADDRQAIANLVDYPLRTRINGKTVTIKDASQFIARYDGIVTAKLRRAVAEQSYANLFANWQGVSIGDGELWFSGIGNADVVRIIAINN